MLLFAFARASSTRAQSSAVDHRDCELVQRPIRCAGAAARSDAPALLAVDGELVAFGSDGLPSFPRLCERMLHGKRRIGYWERRQLLEQLDLHGDHWATTPAYSYGEALWE